MDANDVKEPPVKACRQDRRDVDAQVDRLIERRLAEQFPLAVINGVVNSQGEHIRPYIARHIQHNRSKYLSSLFWTQFFKEFDMKFADLSDLPDPSPADEEPDPQLVDAIKMAHHDNPAQRTVEPIERLCETMKRPSYTEFFGMLTASQEAPAVTKTASLRMKVAILGCVARFS